MTGDASQDESSSCLFLLVLHTGIGVRLYWRLVLPGPGPRALLPYLITLQQPWARASHLPHPPHKPRGSRGSEKLHRLCKASQRLACLQCKLLAPGE